MSLKTLKLLSALPSVEGGVMLRFGCGDLELYIETYPDGEVGYSIVENGKVIESQDFELKALKEQQEHDERMMRLQLFGEEESEG